ncbi:MAG: hypothetical protein QOH81_1103 [Sphingomonadales bacterium]|jgi:hypothetical protein|nr:hypothetical protein [Sphingomonadales bacterium]
MRGEREVSARRLVEGYDVLFDEPMRAAHRGCLDYGRTFREDRWPVPLDVLTFAELYGVSPAELGALFGFVLQSVGGRQVWVDTMRGPVHPMVSGLDLGRAQAVALGWHKAAVEMLAPRPGH